MITEDFSRPQGPVHTPVHLKMRCPKCFKLYTVNSAEVKESKPKFQCLDCQQKFWIPYPEAREQAAGIIGFPLEWLETASEPGASRASKSIRDLESEVEPDLELRVTAAFQCPQCSEPYAGGESECQKCGTVFEKFIESRERTADEPSASRELKDKWQAVVESYDHIAFHEAFIAMAQADESLAYALYRYQEILKINPSDEMADRGRKMVEALMGAKVEAMQPVRKSDPSTNFSMPRLSLGTFLLFMCAVTIGVGLLVPGLRNLVGVGSAVLFFILALRYYFRVL